MADEIRPGKDDATRFAAFRGTEPSAEWLNGRGSEVGTGAAWLEGGGGGGGGGGLRFRSPGEVMGSGLERTAADAILRKSNGCMFCRRFRGVDPLGGECACWESLRKLLPGGEAAGDVAADPGGGRAERGRLKLRGCAMCGEGRRGGVISRSRISGDGNLC